jgi:hypothetical protein
VERSRRVRYVERGARAESGPPELQAVRFDHGLVIVN